MSRTVYGAASAVEAPPVAVVAWVGFQARSAAIAEELGGVPYFVARSPWLMRTSLLPLRYAVDVIETWRTLARLRPRSVVAISPPVFAPLTAWLWCALHRVPLVIDCHTSAFDHRWRWTRGLHRWLAGRVRALAVHTEEARETASAWTNDVFLLPDELPNVPSRLDCDTNRADGTRPLVVVAGSLNDEEPIEATLRAAALLPECTFLFTGDVSRVPRSWVDAAPGNVRFSGWLQYPSFIAALQDADLVATFSTGPHMVNRAAFEAIAVDRALLLSDFPALRERFGEAAAYCANEPEAMALGVRDALARQSCLRRAGAEVRGDLVEAREAAMRRLRGYLVDEVALPALATDGEAQR